MKNRLLFVIKMHKVSEFMFLEKNIILCSQVQKEREACPPTVPSS